MNGIPAWAYRGAPVVCIDDTEPEFCAIDWRMRADDVYTLVYVGICSDCGKPECRVAEQPEGIVHLDRFKPLITQQDDISTHFARYLNTGKDASLKPVREGV